MKDRQHQTGVSLSDESPPTLAPGFSDSMKDILEKILQTREGRSLIADTIPVVLKAWAGNSGWRNAASKMAAGTLKNGFGEIPPDGHNAIEALFQDPVFLELLFETLSALSNSTADVLAVGVQTLERMPLEDKKKMASALISQLMNGKTGDILTRCFRVISDIQKNDPAFLTQLMTPGFETWVASVDFGEIKEAVDGSAQSMVSLVEMANDVLWRYPAKVILLLSLLPSFANITGSTALVSLRKLEDIPPDLLSDILISMIREIDGPTLAELVNSLTEIIRKLHIGSALLGEAGAPQLPKLFSEKLSEIIDETDPVVLWKARTAMAEIRASFDQALAEAIHGNTDHLNLAMTKSPHINNIRMQNINRKLMMFESMDDEVFTDLWTKCLTACDVQETADVLNNVLRLINRLGDRNPEAWAGVVSRFSSAIDEYELSETAGRLLGDVDGPLPSLARSVVPGLVTWFCHVLEPKDDEYEEDAARAREALRSLLLPEED
jgi:hypothetical protein